MDGRMEGWMIDEMRQTDGNEISGFVATRLRVSTNKVAHKSEKLDLSPTSCDG